MSERFFYKTSKECCDFYFNGDDCDVINVCGDEDVIVQEDDNNNKDDGTTQAPTVQPTHKPTKLPGDIPPTYQMDGCHPNRLWHADTRLGKYDAGCTNNDVYPPGWTKPPMSENMFFDSPKTCCDFFFEGKECDWIDVCAFIDLNGSDGTLTSSTTITSSSSVVAGGTAGGSTDYTYPPDNPCHARKWHPDTNSLPSICTNDKEYPALWDNGIMDGISMFDDPGACCDKLKRTNGDEECLIVEDEVCMAVVVIDSPTVRPTVLSSDEDEDKDQNEGGGGDEGGEDAGSDCGAKWHPDTGKLIQGCMHTTMFMFFLFVTTKLYG